MDISNNLTDIINVVGNDYSICFLKNDNTAVTFGNASYGGDSSSVTSSLVNIKQIFCNTYSYAALHYDGTVTCWGVRHMVVIQVL